MASEPNGEYGRSCIDCPTSGCAENTGVYPAFCPTAALPESERDAVRDRYREPDEFAIMSAASDSSARAFSEQWCRVEETMYYAYKMGAKKIGIAACSGLLKEASVLADVLRSNGFDVYGIACKVGALQKADFGIAASCCDYGAVSCDPLLQAQLLNEAGTDLNIVVGLCVGHDILFQRHIDAPSTTLVVKDRALYHNSVAALNALGQVSPYNRMMHFAPLAESREVEEDESEDDPAVGLAGGAPKPCCC